MQYIKSEKNGDQRLDEQTVSEEYVKDFTALATRKFFENLGGRESMRTLSDGVIHCVSVSPDGAVVRTVVFTPIAPSVGEVQP